MDPSVEITKGEYSRLLSTIHQAYVRNRNKEMDRIDNSTGWSVGILVLMLSFMMTSGVPFYFIPFSIIVILPFWIKESRRYVYYMFWSHKESEIENQIQYSIESGKYDRKAITRIIDFKKPGKLIHIEKALSVRFYRSYYWMIMLIYIATVLLAISQSAMDNIYTVIILAISFIILILLGIKGKDETLLPRKTIMHLSIKYNI